MWDFETGGNDNLCGSEGSASSTGTGSAEGILRDFVSGNPICKGQEEVARSCC